MTSYFEAKNIEELCSLMGLPESEAPKIKIRLGLAKAIRRAVEKKELTHVEASEKAGVGPTVMTAIMNGNLDKISTDRLIDIAQALGLRLQLKVA
jgi:predicted XRE-type DNA-binding protein